MAVPQSHSPHSRNSLLHLSVLNQLQTAHTNPEHTCSLCQCPSQSMLDPPQECRGRAPSWELILGSNGQWEEDEGRSLSMLFHETVPKALTRSTSVQAARELMQSSPGTLQKVPMEPRHLWDSEGCFSHKIWPHAAEQTSHGKWEEERALRMILADLDFMKRTFEKVFAPWQCRLSYRNKHRSLNLGTASRVHYNSCQKSFPSHRGCCLSEWKSRSHVQFGVWV